MKPSDLQEAIALTVQGTLGYYARFSSFNAKECKAIDEIVAQAIRAHNLSTTIPRDELFATKDAGGMGYVRAAPVCAAAKID